DGVLDIGDNCPLDGNSSQADVDFDGLGDACDSTYNAGSVAQQAETVAVNAVQILVDINVSGGNGLINKLTGKGGITQKLGNAITAFSGGFIDLPTYLSELQAALSKLNDFDSQLAAKTQNGQIQDPEATNLQSLSGQLRVMIQSLITAVGG
ncbi:MAG: hypothetical protein OEL91_06705, partial [Burkholderiaceae bacterium]|nr:hypothetical protein [Burkholderiaceae bacterium]